MKQKISKAGQEWTLLAQLGQLKRGRTMWKGIIAKSPDAATTFQDYGIDKKMEICKLSSYILSFVIKKTNYANNIDQIRISTIVM